MLYLTSLSYIDFVPYVHFKTEHNFLNEYSFNAWLIVLQLYLRYHAIFVVVDK